MKHVFLKTKLVYLLGTLCIISTLTPSTSYSAERQSQNQPHSFGSKWGDLWFYEKTFATHFISTKVSVLGDIIEEAYTFLMNFIDTNNKESYQSHLDTLFQIKHRLEAELISSLEQQVSGGNTEEVIVVTLNILKELKAKLNELHTILENPPHTTNPKNGKKVPNPTGLAIELEKFAETLKTDIEKNPRIKQMRELLTFLESEKVAIPEINKLMLFINKCRENHLFAPGKTAEEKSAKKTLFTGYLRHRLKLATP